MSEVMNATRTQGKADAPARPASQPVDASQRVVELQVSGHLMSLESGLFCVFQTPGSAPSDPATGLPGVRITPAPGIAGRPEAVSVSTFREDGWLNGTGLRPVMSLSTSPCRMRIGIAVNFKPGGSI